MTAPYVVGARVQVETTGALATVVNQVDARFVDIDYDEPQPIRYADGTPTTTRCSCIHVALLVPAGSQPLDLWPTDHADGSTS